MMQFLIFANECYEASGGWNDLIGEAASLDEGRSIARRFDADHQPADIWWHIVDSVSGKIVLNVWDDPETPSMVAEMRWRMAHKQR